MNKIHNIEDVKFEDDYIILSVDDQKIRLRLSEVSGRLAIAIKAERDNYRISPSGYCIHWKMIDEDLSINGLLEAANASHILQFAK